MVRCLSDLFRPDEVGGVCVSRNAMAVAVANLLVALGVAVAAVLVVFSGYALGEVLPVFFPIVLAFLLFSAGAAAVSFLTKR